MSTQEFIKDFNKLARQPNFLSSGNEVALQNKLLLVQDDITNVSSKNFNSLEMIDFYSNINNILSQSRDIQSPLVDGCFELLISSMECKNTELKKIVCEINFLPAVYSLLMRTESRNEEKTFRVLVLLKSLVTNNGSDHLDEYSTAVLVSVLCGIVDSCQSKKVFKLSLNALSNLAMQGPSISHLIRESIDMSKLSKKMNQAAKGLMKEKYFTIIMGVAISRKEFPQLIHVSLLSIKAALATYDAEPIQDSIDLIKHEKKEMDWSNVDRMQEPIVKLLKDLNCLLIAQEDVETQHDLQDEFIDKILQYYVLLLEFDRQLVTPFSTLTNWIFASRYYLRSPSAFAYLSTYISLNGSFTDKDQSIESLLREVSNMGDNEDGDYDWEYALLNFLSTLCRSGLLKQDESALKVMEKMVSRVKEYKIEDVNKRSIKLAVYLLHALYLLSQRSNRFSDLLTDLLGRAILPYMIAKAYTLQDEDVLAVLFDLSSMPQFPKAATAELIACANRLGNVINQPISLTRSLTIDYRLQQKLKKVVGKINQLVDDGNLQFLNDSEVLSLNREQIKILEARLGEKNDYVVMIKRQNLRLSTLIERRDQMYWNLQCDKKQAQEDKRLLTNMSEQLNESLSRKTMEVEKLKAEMNLMERENLSLKTKQKENENRIKQLEKELEHEKHSRQEQATKAAAEQKKLIEKIKGVKD